MHEDIRMTLEIISKLVSSGANDIQEGSHFGDNRSKESELYSNSSICQLCLRLIIVIYRELQEDAAIFHTHALREIASGKKEPPKSVDKLIDEEAEAEWHGLVQACSTLETKQALVDGRKILKRIYQKVCK